MLREQSSSPESASSGETVAQSDRTIRCARCGHALTTEAAAMRMTGAHELTFFNPAGVVHTIRCFDEAPGVRTVGEASGEFTWFPGWRWRIGLCDACGAHVGWRYEQIYGAFFGLRADALAYE